ncbi:MAG: homoserine dehydrogenase [Candidatus Kapabacteria bacterium]|nr:homoserine dehydrogenase [Candidatus Kapabacteria bacterium]
MSTTTSPQRIGLFGFGVVGQGLFDVLHRTPGLQTEITRICVKNRSKSRPIPASHFTYERNDILDDPNIDVVVELIDDADAAFEIVSKALRVGKSVVTANKRLVATRLRELLDIQMETGSSLLYEASTCGSIPIIRNLEEYYDNDMLSRVEGIVNGTTNYILTALHEPASTGYASALAQAQVLGFAESDPTLDVEAFDAAFKTTIIAAHAFGVVVNPTQIVRRGITTITPFDVSIAQQQSRTIKLLSRVQLHGNGLSLLALPALSQNASPLAGIRNEVNAVRLTAAFSDAQLLVGKGAGGGPTASAVLSDIAALRYGYRYEYKKLNQASRPVVGHNVETVVYVRGTNEQITSIPFSVIDVDHRSSRGRYVIGHVQLDALHKSAAFQDPETFIAIVPED